jgi:hypothetical protein
MTTVFRDEGAAFRHLLAVAAAPPVDFVRTLRLEEELGGAYTWRNILNGWFRFSPAILNTMRPSLSVLFIMHIHCAC